MLGERLGGHIRGEFYLIIFITKGQELLDLPDGFFKLAGTSSRSVLFNGGGRQMSETLIIHIFKDYK